METLKQSLIPGHTPVTAQEFLAAFRKEWEALRERVSDDEQIIEAYGKNSEWTAWMLGHTRGKRPPELLLPEKTGFLGKIGGALGFSAEQIRREDYTLDCSYVSGVPIVENNHWGYASHLSVLIEHESDVNSIEYEMWKLLFWRAPLKVIISYKPIEDSRRRDANAARLVEKLVQLKEMREKVTSIYREPDGTEYLIIIGERDDDKSMPRWSATINFNELNRLSIAP